MEIDKGDYKWDETDDIKKGIRFMCHHDFTFSWVKNGFLNYGLKN